MSRELWTRGHRLRADPSAILFSHPAPSPQGEGNKDQGRQKAAFYQDWRARRDLNPRPALALALSGGSRFRRTGVPLIARNTKSDSSEISVVLAAPLKAVPRRNSSSAAMANVAAPKILCTGPVPGTVSSGLQPARAQPPVDCIDCTYCVVSPV